LQRIKKEDYIYVIDLEVNIIQTWYKFYRCCKNVFGELPKGFTRSV